MLRSVNFLAITPYLWFLLAVARTSATNVSYQPRILSYLYGQSRLFILFFGLTFILPFRTYNTIDGAVFLFLAFPNALWVIWKMRHTIDA